MNTLFERNIANYKDEWLTPPSIIRALGEFDLDPCSPVGRPWDTAKNHYTVEDNGLMKVWFDRIWCNPPYSNIEEWIKKCVLHGNCIALTFARTDTRLFFKYIWEKADSIFFIKKRIQFLDIYGNKKHNAGAPSVLIAYGDNNVETLDQTTLPGKHLIINSPTIIVVGVSPTWISIVTIAVKNYGDAELKPLYEMVERIAPDKIARNKFWKEKVRQQVQIIRKQKHTTATEDTIII